MSRRPSTLIAVVAAAMVLGGCGIPSDEAARPVQPPPGPYQALASQPPAEDSQTGTVTETLCLIKDDFIVTVKRRLTADPSVDTVLRDLLAGPTQAERTAGLGSALPGTAVIDTVAMDNGVAVVSIGTGLQGTGRSDEVLAIGQVVCTLDARADVSGVAFVHDGQRVSVPRGDGSLSKDSLTTADYAVLLAQR